MENLIEIKQLPIIEQQLKQVSLKINEEMKDIEQLVCTEESIQILKKKRAEFNKDFKEYETQRKEVKEKVFKPYNEFEEIYKRYIADKYRNTDLILKGKIDVFEKEQKEKKEQEVKDYFEEYKTSLNIDFITYEQAKINVTLTASMKSLKEQAKAFIDRVNSDLATIALQEHKDEILVEYKQNGLILNKAMETVLTRIKAVEEEKRKQEEKVVHIEMNENHEITQKSYEELENVMNKPLEQPTEEKLQAPTKEDDNEVVTVPFKATATRKLLRRLKEIMEELEIKYE